MFQLELHIQPHTEKQLQTIMSQFPDQELFAKHIIAFQISELKKGLLNLRLDLQEFEQQYNKSTETFYGEFTAGNLEDIEDFMLWAGIYELLQDNECKLKALI